MPSFTDRKIYSAKTVTAANDATDWVRVNGVGTLQISGTFEGTIALQVRSPSGKVATEAEYTTIDRKNFTGGGDEWRLECTAFTSATDLVMEIRGDK